MKRILLIAALAIAAASGSFAAGAAGAAGADGADGPRRITVEGQGRIEAAPDMATITLGVTSQARKAGDAMRETSRGVAAMLKRLTGLGVAPKDIQTRSVTLNPVWSNRSASSGTGNSITGFSASNTVLVRVRNLEALGAVLDAVVADGANTFSGLRFSLQNPEPLAVRARQDAVRYAMAKATQIAQAAGISTGRILSISAHDRGGPVVMEMAAARLSGPVPVAPGEVTVTESVTLVVEIADD